MFINIKLKVDIVGIILILKEKLKFQNFCNEYKLIISKSKSDPSPYNI